MISKIRHMTEGERQIWASVFAAGTLVHGLANETSDLPEDAADRQAVRDAAESADETIIRLREVAAGGTTGGLTEMTWAQGDPGGIAITPIEGMELDVKRLYVPFTFRSRCPGCGAMVTRDDSDYLSCPVLDEPYEVGFYHEHEIDGEWDESRWTHPVVFHMTAEAVAG
jgi:hypothetical protein